MISNTASNVKLDIEDSVELMNEQIKHFRRLAERHSPTGYVPDTNRCQLYTRLVERHENALSVLQSVGEDTDNVLPFKPTKTPISDFDDLPPELIEQLARAPQKDTLGMNVRAVIEDAGGVADLDTILIGLYRKTGEIQERRYLSNKMYRMAQTGQLVSVPKKKGVYTLPGGGAS